MTRSANDKPWWRDIRYHIRLVRPQELLEFRQALAMSRDQNARMLELRAAMSLCRLQQRRDDPTEARQLLEQIYGGFTEGFATPDLAEARALLEQLGGSPEATGEERRAARPA